MPWGPEDWDALTQSEQPGGTRPISLEQQALLRSLRRIPRRQRMTVADLGCGRGDLLPFLASHFRNVVAIDYAPVSLAWAREGCDGKAVTFRRRDLRDLTPFRGAFHVAVAVNSILGPRLSDVDRILDQIHRSLVEGGILLATFQVSPRGGTPRALPLCDERSEVLTPLIMSEAEVQYHVRRAGFRGVSVRRLAEERGFRDRLLCIATRRANN